MKDEISDETQCEMVYDEVDIQLEYYFNCKE